MSDLALTEDAMLYGVFCYHDEALVNSWSKAEDDAVIAKRRAVTEKVQAKGKLGPVARLMPTTAAVTVRNGKDGLVVDGPFAETKEQLLGFYVVDCNTLDEAIAFARDLGKGESGSFEIRPLRLFDAGTAKP
jgi:hypothetical protein